MSLQCCAVGLLKQKNSCIFVCRMENFLFHSVLGTKLKFYLLHFGNITNESFVVHMFAKALQLVKVPDEVLANPLVTETPKGWVLKEKGRTENWRNPQRSLQFRWCVWMRSSADLSDDLSQPGVAHDQPAAGSDAVGLVLELVRLHFVEVLETVNTADRHTWATRAALFTPDFLLNATTRNRLVVWGYVHCGFEDVRVNLGHAVDGVGAHDAQVSHVNPLLTALFNQRHATHALVISRELGCNFLKNYK